MTIQSMTDGHSGKGGGEGGGVEGLERETPLQKQPSASCSEPDTTA